VVINGRDKEKLALIGQQLGENALAVQADITKLADIDKLMDETRAKFGKMDVLFVNAGIAMNSPLDATSEATFDEVMNTNFKGPYYTIQKALPLLNDGASIIINGSINALIGLANTSLYSASKAAVHSLARTLSAELVGRGIRVNTIAIGPTDTPIINRPDIDPEITRSLKQKLSEALPVKRLGQPEEIARVALFLASSDSSFIVGSEIAADGGITANLKPSFR
jgi:NAD(P)-dependent dehydrogenase (short-subunit alcohol dehydrogenase family)